MNKSLRWLFPIAALILAISMTTFLAACGGDDPPPRDTTPPSLSSSTPADGETDVDPEKINTNGIMLTFSEAISKAELMLSRDGDNFGWISSVEGHTVMLYATPANTLVNETAYMVSGSVEDASGNSADVSISFTTKAKDPAVLESSWPPSGVTVAEGSTVTLIFDKNPGTVTVNGNATEGSGRNRTFTLMQATNNIAWDDGGTATLTFTLTEFDTTPPSLSSSTPANGATDVDPEKINNNGITLTFSEDISKAELMSRGTATTLDGSPPSKAIR